MRCPDCGTDYPVKPEVVIKKEPCTCGLTAEVRIAGTVVRGIATAVIFVILSLSGCTVFQSYLNSRLAQPGESINSDGGLWKPFKK